MCDLRLSSQICGEIAQAVAASGAAFQKMPLTIYGIHNCPHDFVVTKVDAPLEQCAFLLDFGRKIERVRWLLVRNTWIGFTVGVMVPVIHLSERSGRFVIGITEELANLKQVADMLRCVEELGKHGDFEDDTGMIVDVIKAARRMIEEVIAAFKAYFAAKGGCAVSRKRFGKEELSAEVRHMQKAAAVLACIQLTAEYDNEVAADLADAVAVVRANVIAVAARLDAVISQNGNEGD